MDKPWIFLSVFSDTTFIVADQNTRFHVKYPHFTYHSDYEASRYVATQSFVFGSPAVYIVQKGLFKHEVCVQGYFEMLDRVEFSNTNY